MLSLVEVEARYAAGECNLREAWGLLSEADADKLRSHSDDEISIRRWGEALKAKRLQLQRVVEGLRCK